MKESGQAISKVLRIGDALEYVPRSIVKKTIVRKPTGEITAVSVDSGETLTAKSSPFETFVQIIDGTADILIDDIAFLLEAGHSIILPAHARCTMKANTRFKMIATVIKSGYED